MAEKLCPGPVCGSNQSAGGYREAVCVHTNKVYDSCKSKECLRDLRVYLCREGQELLNSGSVVAVKPRSAELLCVKIDVERVQFKCGIRCYYMVAGVCGRRGRTCKFRFPGLFDVTRTVFV